MRVSLYSWSSLCLLILACSQAPDTFARPQERWCPFVAVENRSWDDVRIYLDGQRVGFVAAQQEEVFRSCRFTGAQRPLLEARAMGGRSSRIPYSGHWPLSDGEGLVVLVALVPGQSYAHPTGGAGGDR